MIDDFARNTCATRVFDKRAFDDGDAIYSKDADRSRPKTRRADSESRFLAIKKFSSSPASRLIGARQIRFFGRIAVADSCHAFLLQTAHRARDGRIATGKHAHRATRRRRFADRF
jgi:hypothetical protein